MKTQGVAVETMFTGTNRRITTEETPGERASQRLSYQNLNNTIQVQPIVKLDLFFRC